MVIEKGQLGMADCTEAVLRRRFDLAPSTRLQLRRECNVRPRPQAVVPGLGLTLVGCGV